MRVFFDNLKDLEEHIKRKGYSVEYFGREVWVESPSGERLGLSTGNIPPEYTESARIIVLRSIMECFEDG